MRQRIIRMTLLVVLGGSAVLCAVMVWASSAGIEEDADDRLTQTAVQSAAVAHDLLDAEHSLDNGYPETLIPEGQQVTLTLDSGEVLSAGDSPEADWRSATEPIPGYGSVTVTMDYEEVRDSQLVSTLSIVGLGLLFAGISSAVAWVQARRLTEPLDDLAARARRVGAADFRITGERYGLPELDEVAEALEMSAARIERMVEAERLLTADASHQLRTPLTALSIRLDEILQSNDLAEVRAEAAAALDQVERLAEVVDDLLVQPAPWPAPETPVSLEAAVARQVTEWGTAFAAAGRRLEAVGEEGLGARVDDGALGQILAALVENSFRHGAGQTTIETRRLDGAAVVEVRDEGPGIPREVAPRVFERGVSGDGGMGTGLARARATAASVGCRLALISEQPACFGLFLPHPVLDEPDQAAGRSPGDGTLGKTQVR